MMAPSRYRKAYSGGIGHDLSLIVEELGDGFESRGRCFVDPNSLTQSANKVISISHGDLWLPDDVLSTDCYVAKSTEDNSRSRGLNSGNDVGDFEEPTIPDTQTVENLL